MFAKIYITALVIFSAIDLFWVGVFANSFYKKHIGFLLTDNVNWYAAVLFYLLFISGLVFFVISPAIQNGNLTSVILTGLFFGAITYATYDLTNLALTKDWPLLVTVIDILYGSILASLVSTFTYILFTR